MLITCCSTVWAEQAGDSIDNPIIISDESSLKAIAEDIAEDGGEGKYYRLESDIDLRGSVWEAYIGTSDVPFMGNFDGNGHIIKNFTLKMPQNGSYGLFAYVGGDAVISDLGVQNIHAELREQWSWDSICGGIAGTVGGNALVNRCYSKNFSISTSFDKTSSNGHIGAAGTLIGKTEGGAKVTSSYAINSNIPDNLADFDGGLIGRIFECEKVENCYSYEALARCYDAYKDKVVNTYYVETAPWPWADGGNSGTRYVGTQVTEEVIKTKAETLGSDFVADTYLINDGYPMLAWEEVDYTPKGEGTSQSPYLIENVAHLAYIAASDDTEGKYYRLEKDIDLEGKVWNTFIGTSEAPFMGSFDGNGHIISDFKLTMPGNGTYGLFGYIGGNAVIYDLGVENIHAELTEQWSWDSVCGGIVGTVGGNAVVDRCYSKGFGVSTSFEKTSANGHIGSAGGLVGKTEAKAKITNSYAINTNLVDNLVDYDGGLIGKIYSCEKVENCYSYEAFARCLDEYKDTVVNSYYVENPTWPWADGGNSGTRYVGTQVTGEGLKAKAEALGESFKSDAYFVNGGYPLLYWESGEYSLKGKGTSESPYLIEKVADLVYIAGSNDTESKFYRLENDIDLGGELLTFSLGTSEAPFSGNFDGNEHIISNFKITMPGNGSYGLFAYVGGDAVIYDLGVENVHTELTEQWSWDSVCGGIVGTLGGKAVVDRCYSKGFGVSTSFEKTSANGHIGSAGGLVGKTEDNAKVTNSYAINTDLIDRLVDYDGGLIGKIASCEKVENCYSYEALSRCLDAYIGNVANSYYVETAPWPWADGGESGTRYVGTQITGDELKAKAESLGSDFVADVNFANSGYPMLVWEKSESKTKGTGTHIDPYLIETVNDLIFVAGLTSTEGKYFKLMNDIDIGGKKWETCIGTSTNVFKGDFNGNGHVIKNYRLDSTVSGVTSVNGLFGYVGGNANIYNLGVCDAVLAINKFCWNDTVGALAGRIQDKATITSCYAKNITFEANWEITAKAQGQFYAAGGIAGAIDGWGVEIRRCYTVGVDMGVKRTTAGEDYHIVMFDGGLAGIGQSFTEIEDCYSDTYLTRSVAGLSVVNCYERYQHKEWESGYDWGAWITTVNTLSHKWSYGFKPDVESYPTLKWETNPGAYISMIPRGNMNVTNPQEIFGTENAVIEHIYSIDRKSHAMKLPHGESFKYTLDFDAGEYYRVSVRGKNASEAEDAKISVKLGDTVLSDELRDTSLGEKFKTKVVYIKPDADMTATLEISSNTDIYIDDVDVVKVNPELEKEAIDACLNLSHQKLDTVSCDLYVQQTVCDGAEIIFDSVNGYIDGYGKLTDKIPTGLGSASETYIATVKVADLAVSKDLKLNIKEQEPCDSVIKLFAEDGKQVFGIDKAEKAVISTAGIIDNAKIYVAFYKGGRLVGAQLVDSDLEFEVISDTDKLKAFVMTTDELKPMALAEETYDEFDTSSKTTIHNIGDSLCATYDNSTVLRGWGQMLGNYFDDNNVTVDNSLARGGMTAEEFVAEGRLDTLKGKLKKNDYVTIQLSTNDKNKFTEEEFKRLLSQLVLVAREKGAIPVFVTPPDVMRTATDNLTEDGSYEVNSVLGSYPEVMRKLSKELNVPLVDMHAESIRIMKELGKTGVNALGYYATRVGDDVHFLDAGANWIAEFVANGIKDTGLPIGDFVIGKDM